MAAWDGPPAPWRVETERLVIRCYRPDDAPAFKAAIDASLDHLRRFLAWAYREPEPLAAKRAQLQRRRAAFEACDDFPYGIFGPAGDFLGHAALHPRVGPGGLELGYWIRADRTREGVATEAAAALTRVAFEICEADRVEIWVEPENVPSARIPVGLGFREEARLRRRMPAPPGEPMRDVVIFTLFREELPDSLAASATLRAFDADGRPLL